MQKKMQRKYKIILAIGAIFILLFVGFACLPKVSYKIDPLFKIAEETFSVKAALTSRTNPDISNDETVKFITTGNLQEEIDKNKNEIDDFVFRNCKAIIKAGNVVQVDAQDNMLNNIALLGTLDFLGGCDNDHTLNNVNESVKKIKNCKIYNISDKVFKALVSRIYGIDYYAVHNINLQKCAKIYLSQIGLSNDEIDSLQQILSNN